MLINHYTFLVFSIVVNSMQASNPPFAWFCNPTCCQSRVSKDKKTLYKEIEGAHVTNYFTLIEETLMIYRFVKI